ncbi:DMT family transporter [Pantoea ananatis]|uniref:DMT family transporter n=1 Tax=Pantoea ananas TaxID=553 RepID=UPI003FA4992B
MSNPLTVLKIFIAMLAFAANSILCRIALRGRHVDPVTFTDLRLLSGAAVLLPLLFIRQGARRTLSLKAGFFLMAYAMFFSVAYIHLDTGTGALILFGVVQLTMIAYGFVQGERLSLYRGLGLLIAAGGIVALLLPGAGAPPPGSAFLMAAAGIAWAAYTLAGKNSPDAAVSTAGNFLLAVPLSLALSPFISTGVHYDTTGIILGVLAGAGASAGAYVLWYTVLPHLDAVTASTVQLSVPCLALLGGVLFSGESPSLRMLFSATAVLSGIALVIGTSRQSKSA